jgi:hypothetical protein
LFPLTSLFPGSATSCSVVAMMTSRGVVLAEP